MAKAGLKAALTASATGQKLPEIEEKPSRIGRRQIAGFFSPDCARQLRRLAADTDRTTQSLIAEALNDLFAKHDLPPLA